VGPVTVLAGEAYAATGRFVLGPIPMGGDPGWVRLRMLADEAAGAHVRLFTRTSHLPNDQPGLPDDGAGGTPEVTPVGAWRAAPRDALDVLALNQPAPYLWLGGRLDSDGAGSAALRRVVFDTEPDTWLRYLPPVYRRDDAGRVLLERILALFESLLDDEEALIDGLPQLLDPDATADDPRPGSWLDWLAGWLALDLEEGWDEPRRRRAVATAFTLHGRRGTVEGLRDLVRLYFDAPVWVEEPAGTAGMWTLDGDQSVLGFTTMLAPAEAQGAVVGTTALMDRSNLTERDDDGTPLFGDLAHRFCVGVYAADLRQAGARDTLVRVLDRERPAHTAYHLCVVEPRLRVGYQARVGVDTIVAGGPGAGEGRLQRRLGFETQLAGAPPHPPAGTIGDTARIGRGTWLT
jgi:phage tail-like protein